ncbi:MAG: hypothetical protein AB7U35_13645, partial [Sphingobium sp.]
MASAIIRRNSGLSGNQRRRILTGAAVIVGDSGLGDDSPRNEMFCKCSFHFPTWITRDMATTQFLIVGVFVDAPARAIPR